MKTALAALALLFSAAVSPLLGQGDDESTRMTLAGVHGVRVVVRVSDSTEVRKDGLTQQLQTDVEIKLRQTGITVLSEQEAQSGPWFQVTISTLKVSPTNATTSIYAVSMTAELQQWVTLTRNPSVSVWVSTWSAEGKFGTTTHLSSVRDVIRDMTDQFINAYLAANPKR